MKSASIEKGRFYLEWLEERAGEAPQYLRWSQPASNICLDFHGDPVRAQLTVFSDGNHHMALRESLDRFVQQNEGLPGIFYATTPPGPIVNLLRNGGLQMGNLIVSVSPHVFIGPPNVLDNLVADGFMPGHVPFVRNQGNILLVKKGNPKKILEVSDLTREDIRLFLSNPDTEKVSFTAYYNTLKAMAPHPSDAPGFPDDKIERGEVVFGTCIHHREAPQAVADGSADAAVVFYHLGLRYTRIFPDIFELVPLGGSVENPEPPPGNVVGQTHMGLVGDGGAWGRNLISFLGSKQVMDIYRHHGLRPAGE